MLQTPLKTAQEKTSQNLHPKIPRPKCSVKKATNNWPLCGLGNTETHMERGIIWEISFEQRVFLH